MIPDSVEGEESSMLVYCSMTLIVCTLKSGETNFLLTEGITEEDGYERKRQWQKAIDARSFSWTKRRIQR